MWAAATARTHGLRHGPSISAIFLAQSSLSGAPDRLESVGRRTAHVYVHNGEVVGRVTFKGCYKSADSLAKTWPTATRGDSER